MLTTPTDIQRHALYAGAAARAASLEGELEQAMARGQIDVRFQPQYSVSDNSLYGAEALTRWLHPTLGVISAPELFFVAERAGCVDELSKHIFTTALHFAGEWPRHLMLSINVTPEELVEESFAERFSALVSWSRVSARQVTVEITEEALLDDIDTAIEATAQLARQGFRIALDDFGAGFCNFHYLKSLPLDAIKLDRSMVEGVAQSERDEAVLRAMVAMAEALSLDVVAEGIESAEQLAAIQRQGCTTWQGFLRGGPMAPETFLQLTRG